MSPPSTPSRSVSFRWPTTAPETSPDRQGSPTEGPSAPRPDRDLQARLESWTQDRASSAEAVVLAAARQLSLWLEERGTGPDVERTIEQALAPFLAAHGWRGAVARWMDSVRRTLRWSRSHGHATTEALAEELGLWCWSGAVSEFPDEDGAWDGTPLARGRRVGDAEAAREHAASLLGARHTVLVHGHSERVAGALERAHARGLEPEALVTEGGADGSGRWLARRLSRAGMRVTLIYDACALDSVPRADRVWLGTEAIGADAFLGRIGTRRLCEEARDADVPVEILALGDDLVPGGEVTLPSWYDEQSWLLWEDAPEGVRLETQLFERVPLDVVTAFVTDVGCESATALHLRALRTEALPPVGA